MLELLERSEDQGLASNLDIKPKLRKYVILKCRMKHMTVSFLSVKNGQRSALSCSLVNTSKEIHPLTIMFDMFYACRDSNFHRKMEIGSLRV